MHTAADNESTNLTQKARIFHSRTRTTMNQRNEKEQGNKQRQPSRMENKAQETQKTFVESRLACKDCERNFEEEDE